MSDQQPAYTVAEGQSAPWAAAAVGGLGLLGILGMGLGRKREPLTKIEKAWAEAQDLSDLCRSLESMISDGQCLLGTEAQDTISPFNADVNVALGEIALLRRRVLLAKAKLHALTIPKMKEDILKFAKKVERAEVVVAEILAMPDVSPEEQAKLDSERQVHRDKSLVAQALSMPGEPHALHAVVTNSGVPAGRASEALNALIAEKLVEASGEGFKWVGHPKPKES